MKQTFILLVILISIHFSKAQNGVWFPKSPLSATVNSSLQGFGVPLQTAFTIGNKAYFYTATASNNFWEYDPSNDSWTSKTDFPGVERTSAVGFEINTKGYLGMGFGSNDVKTDFYEYEPANDTWIPRTDFPDSAVSVFGFAIGPKGYCGGGVNPHWYSAVNSFYEYNPVNNSWTQKNDIPESAWYAPISASANGKGYYGIGFSTGGPAITNILEYTPITDSWDTLIDVYTSFGNIDVVLSSFIINTDMYLFTENQDMWKINLISRTGQKLPNTSCFEYYAFALNGKGYAIGNGFSNTQQYDPASYFSINSVTPDSICEGQPITISFSSNISFDPGNGFYVRFTPIGPGNSGYIGSSSYIDSASSPGTYTFIAPQGIAGTYISRYSLNVVSTYPEAETFPADTIILKRGPLITDLYPPYSICAGTSLDVSSYYQSYQTYLWTTESGTVLSTSNYFSAYPDQDTTYFLTSSFAVTGCVISDTIPVTIIPLPDPQIANTQLAVCGGDSATVGAAGIADYYYEWSDFGNFQSNDPFFNTAPVNSTNYYLTVTDLNTGCSKYTSVAVDIKEAPAQPICMVTVDISSNHNIVVWEKADKEATDSFYIYRETSTNNYSQIAAIHRDSLSEYHDYSANPNITGYRYKIATKDTCGNVGGLSDYHNTIHLAYLGGGNLQWNVYEVENNTTPVSTFDIYRDTTGTGNWQPMVTVPGNQTTTTDINYNQNPNVSYRVVANWSNSCTSSRSQYGTVVSNIISKNGTAVNTISEDDRVQVYPNPSSGIFFITLSNGVSQVREIEILNMLGQKIDKQPLYAVQDSNNLKVERPDAASGLYILQLTLGDKVVNKKIQLQ